jgi:carboxymethylenebutenolidase
MPRVNVDIPTTDGACPSVVVTPQGEGPWPAVIVFMDAGGVRPAIVEIAEQIASQGYVALVPEMYYRSGPYEPFRIETAFSDPDERKRLGSLAGALTKAMAVRDTTSFLGYLADRADVAGTKVGTTGYCMGGALSLTAAAHHPERIAAAASFHGGNLASDAPDSPHLVAEDDGSFPPEQATMLDDALTDGGVEHVIEIYPAHHGFAVPDNATYDVEAATRHLGALDALYAESL